MNLFEIIHASVTIRRYIGFSCLMQQKKNGEKYSKRLFAGRKSFVLKNTPENGAHEVTEEMKCWEFQHLRQRTNERCKTLNKLYVVSSLNNFFPEVY